jgi:hypothetical protein
MPRLDIKALSERHHAITSAVAADLYEAACVCLHRHHTSPQTLEVDNEGDRESVEIEWDEPDERTLSARASERPTTEAGASAIVVAAVEHARGLFAVTRGDVGSGADYYLLPNGVPFDDLEEAVRLEVSGVNRGPAGRVRRRMIEKVRQALRGDNNLPAIVGVVGFSCRLVLLQELEIIS